MVRIDYDKPGAQQFINSWVDMLAAWGIHYIKIDGMQNNVPDIRAWSTAYTAKWVADASSTSPRGKARKRHRANIDEVREPVDLHRDVERHRCEKGGSSYPLTSRGIRQEAL